MQRKWKTNREEDHSLKSDLLKRETNLCESFQVTDRDTFFNSLADSELDDLSTRLLFSDIASSNF